MLIPPSYYQHYLYSLAWSPVVYAHKLQCLLTDGVVDNVLRLLHADGQITTMRSKHSTVTTISNSICWRPHRRKRIAATLFLWFMQNNGILYRTDGTKRISDGALVALTLMIAESKTEEKDVMLKVVVNLINKKVV